MSLSRRVVWRWITGDGEQVEVPIYGVSTVADYRWMTLHVLGPRRLVCIETDCNMIGVVVVRASKQDRTKLRMVEERFRPITVLWRYDRLRLQDKAMIVMQWTGNFARRLLQT